MLRKQAGVLANKRDKGRPAWRQAWQKGLSIFYTNKNLFSPLILELYIILA